MSSTDENRHDFRHELDRAGNYAKNTLDGFRTFILRGNVVDLAIGIVIGAAFTAVVNGLVTDIITPLIPTPTGNLADAYIAIPWTGNHHLLYGAFINSIISFLIVAAVLYFFVVRPVAAFMARYKPPVVAAPTTRDCPYCLQAIPMLATRCSFCTSQVSPIDEHTGAPLTQRPGHNA